MREILFLNPYKFTKKFFFALRRALRAVTDNVCNSPVFFCMGVIPCESSEKPCFFFTKKIKSFWYFSNKNIFLRPNLVIFVYHFFFNPLKIFFLIFLNKIFNIMFYYSFSCQKCHTFRHRSKSLLTFTFLCFFLSFFVCFVLHPDIF